MATPARPSAGAAQQHAPGTTRSTALPEATRDITAIPRAVITAAVGVVHTVERAVGNGPIRTARDNAWEAVCADRAIARQRDEIRRTAAASGRAAVRAPRSAIPSAR